MNRYAPVVAVLAVLIGLSTNALGEKLDRDRLPGRQVKVAAVCVGMSRLDQTNEQYEARVKMALDDLDSAGKEGVDIACLTEDFASKEPQPIPGPITNAVAEMAKKHQMYVICHVREQADGRRYNTAVLFDRRGEIAGTYRKVFPSFTERSVPSRGGTKVFDTDFGRIGVITCFESNFPELWNEADLLGAELVFWLSGGGGGVWVNAYATLHNYYVVAVGDGQIADMTGPDRTDVQRPRRRLVIATLDLDRTMVHNNFNVPKIEKLLAEHKGEVELERHFRVEGWYLLRSVKPGVRVRDLCRTYDIEILRDYRNRSRAAVEKARQAGEEVR